jgi:glycosyltransferase involved in cell wall biosynthesis
MSLRPPLLFVAPILPAQTGNGLAMRAGVLLDALARDFSVTLLIVPVAAGTATSRLSRFVTARTRRTVVLSLEGKLDSLWELCSRLLDSASRTAALAEYPRPALCRYATKPCLDELRATFSGQRFDAVHVVRSYLAPYVAPFLDGTATCTSLDLDDDEALTHRGLAALAARMGRSEEARIEVAEAAKYERHEAEWLGRFGLLVTCTADHAERIALAHPGSRVVIVPNTVRLPRLPIRRSADMKRVLFVGNLSYAPNVEGILRFALEVLPRLRAEHGRAVALRIAGSDPVPEVLALSKLPGVELVVNPESLARHYAWADLAVVPVAAGGGTRIKLLEAFAYGVPVVSTGVGAAGIAVEDGVHLLLADSSEQFADACADILGDGRLGASLAANARKLVEASYAHASAVRLIRRELGVGLRHRRDDRPGQRPHAPRALTPVRSRTRCS